MLSHKKLLLLAAFSVISTLPAQDLVVQETLGGSAILVKGDQAVAAGWTQRLPANNASIWVHLFANELPGAVSAYLIRSLGADAAGREVATTRIVTGTDRWERLFTNVNLSPGTYYVVLASFSGSTGWRQADFGFERLAPGVTLEPARFFRGAVPAYPPSATFTNLADTRLTLIVSTDAEYFTPFSLIEDSLSDAFVGQDYSCAITHSRPGPGPFRWTVPGSLPPGLSLIGDERTGALRLAGRIPADARRVPYPVNIQLVDVGRNRSATLDTTISYADPGAVRSIPVPRSGYHRGGIVGQRYVDQYDAQGGLPPYRFSFTGSLPLGLTLDETSGQLSGTPTAAGTTRASISIRDSNNQFTTSNELPFRIVPPAPANADHLNTGSPQRMLATTGAEFDQTLAVGVNTSAIEPYLSLLPPGLVLAANGRLTGRVAAPGNYGFCVRGQSASGRVIRCFWVIALPPRQAAFQALPVGNLGARYDQPLFLSLTGGLTGQYFFELLDQNGQPVAGNVVAPGLTLTPDGRVVGLPTQAGSFPIRARVRDYSSYWVGGTSDVFTAPSPLTITADTTAPLISGVTHGASFATGAISPGQVITLFGANLGPAELTTLALGADGRAVTTLAGTQVTVNNIPAPILYTSASQVSIVVPFGVSGINASILVTYNERTATAAYSVPITIARPALFTRNGSGSGLPAALNQDGSIHGPDAPAEPGSVLVLYGTGAGPTRPSGIDGTLTSTLAPLLLPVSVTIGGLSAEVLFAGAAPGLVAGVFQLNVRIPAGVFRGEAVPLVVSAGGNRSPNGVFINLR